MVPSDEIQPASEKNLDRYGNPPLSWARALERLEQEFQLQAPGTDDHSHTHWLATVRPDGRPHVAAVGVVWLHGAFYFSAGARTRKAKNLAQNPQSVISIAAEGIDLVLEGKASKVSDDALLSRVAEALSALGWTPTVRDGAFYQDYSAPSAGPPPWEVYEFRPKTIFGVATREPYGATRWRL
jgi:nitroimidazol reductase NimA-like FMN-containing flavoprotein (pyridoxamine 5'-phosphate oxidase superfamily)